MCAHRAFLGLCSTPGGKTGLNMALETHMFKFYFILFLIIAVATTIPNHFFWCPDLQNNKPSFRLIRVR